MHPNEIAINDYVDEALAPAERADVDLHVASCAECRALVDDLRELRRAAGSLDVREVPVRAWTRIERAITLEAESARSTQIPQKGFVLRAPRALRSTSGLMWLAAAAVLLLATAVGLRVLPRTLRTDTPANPPGVAVSSDTAQSVEAELRQAEAHYEKAIKGLEQIANAEKGALDPGTAATLQENMGVVDQAINESRAALNAQPASDPARRSLLDSFKAKIELLQNTVALINDVRTGDDAGAAQVISRLKRGN